MHHSKEADPVQWSSGKDEKQTKNTKYKDEDGRIEVYDSDRKKAGENLKIACQEYINNYNYDFVKEDKDALKEETRKIRECEKYISEVK